ncbi:hypothetical protein JCM10449v2_000741 [Rhodotorula kratochvilovae]
MMHSDSRQVIRTSFVSLASHNRIAVPVPRGPAVQPKPRYKSRAERRRARSRAPANKSKQGASAEPARLRNEGRQTNPTASQWRRRDPATSIAIERERTALVDATQRAQGRSDRDDLATRLHILGYDVGERNTAAISVTSEDSSEAHYYEFRASQLKKFDRKQRETMDILRASSGVSCVLDQHKKYGNPDEAIASAIETLSVLDNRNGLRLDAIREQKRQRESELRSLAARIVHNIAAKIRKDDETQPVLLGFIGHKLDFRSSSASGADSGEVVARLILEQLAALNQLADDKEIECILRRVPEGWTSQTCPDLRCYMSRLKGGENEGKPEKVVHPIEKGTGITLLRLLQCAYCLKVFNRDALGSANIATVGFVASNFVKKQVIVFRPEVEALLRMAPRKRKQKWDGQVSTAINNKDGEVEAHKIIPMDVDDGNIGAAEEQIDNGGLAAGSPSISHDNVGTASFCISALSSSRRPIGIDGNCGYRSIAQLVGGDQDKYAALRDASVEVARTLYPTLEMVAAGASTTAMLADGMQNGTNAGHDLRRFSNVDEFLDDMAGNKQWLEDAHCVSVATALQQVIFVVSNEQVKGSMEATDMLRMTAYYPFLVHELELDEQQGVTGAARKMKVQDIVERLRAVFPINPNGAILVYNTNNTHFEVECPKAYKQVVEQHSAFTEEVTRVRLFKSTQGKAMGGETSASGTPVGCMCARVFHLADDPNWSADVFTGEQVFKDADGRTG